MNRTVLPHRLQQTVRRHEVLIKWLSTALIVAGFAVFLYSLPARQAVSGVIAHMQQMGPRGAALFALVFVVLTIFSLPTWPLSVSAGAIFGLLEGTVLVSVVSTSAAALAFLLARHIARAPVARYFAPSPKWRALDEALHDEGWKVVAAVRLLHLMPFGLQNYLLGLTSIRFRTYLATSWAVMLPGTFLYVYVGYLGGTSLEAVGQGDEAVPLRYWLLRLAGLGVAVGALVFVTYGVRKALKARLSEEQRKTLLESSEDDDESAEAPERGRRRPWGAWISMLAAVLVLSLAAWSYTHQDELRRFVEEILVVHASRGQVFQISIFAESPFAVSWNRFSAKIQIQ